jgi:hypothetical protein
MKKKIRTMSYENDFLRKKISNGAHMLNEVIENLDHPEGLGLGIKRRRGGERAFLKLQNVF